MTTYYFDMDGVLADFHAAYATNKSTALHRASMASLAPFKRNVQLVRDLIAAGSLVYILTAAANDEGRMGKIDWLTRYIPELDMTHFICIVGHGKKVDYIREPGVLVDDDPRNTRPWIKAGFAAVLLTTKGEDVASLF